VAALSTDSERKGREGHEFHSCRKSSDGAFGTAESRALPERAASNPVVTEKKAGQNAQPLLIQAQS
jgi:hypothetical protein